MTYFRETLVDRMIRVYGFEHDCVLAFISLCERYEDSLWNDHLLEILVESHEADPFMED